MKTSNLCTSCKAGILCQCNKIKRKEKENVDHPDHYLKSSGNEVIDVIHAWDLDFNLGNAVKYICRAGHKESTIQDLTKAIHYLTNELQHVTKSSEGIPDSVWDHLIATDDRDPEIFDR